MKQIIRLSLGGAATCVLMLGLAAPTLALSRQNVDARCQLAETRLGVILTRMQTIDTRREAAYKDAVARVKAQLQKAETAGYDVTQLRADYQILNTDVLAHHNDRLTLENDIQAAKELAPGGCGASQGQFIDDLRAARQQLAVVRGDDAAIRSDLNTKIYPDLRAYVAWLKQQGGDSSTN